MKRWASAVVGLSVGALVMIGLTSAAAEPKLPDPAAAAKIAHAGPPASSIPTLESTYVPIRPCRAADTRSSSAGVVKHSTTRPFYIRGATGFTGQGGTAAGCGIPTAATGVTVNTTVTHVTGSGFMTNYPAGSTQPLSNFVFYNKNVTGTSNPTFTLAPNGAEPSVLVHASGGANADLIIDITGYYIPQIQALVNPAGAIYSGSPRVLNAVKQSTGYFRVEIDTNVTYCAPMVHTYYENEYATASTVSSQYVYVHVWYLNGTTHVETPVDDYFYLSVHC